MLFRDCAQEGEGYFWGWRSMTPQLKDVQDLWANLKYFLLPSARATRRSVGVLEKFDYLAVFWASA